MIVGLGQASSTDATKAQITQIAQQYGVDPSLALAVAQQESGFQQTGKNGQTLQSTLANGQPGALGVFQLMPATAASLGVNPNDQTGNITGGVKYLSQLLQQFGGNVPNALAAYNAGPGAVQKYGGIPPYQETQNYVSSIMANYQSMGGSTTSGTVAPSGDDGTAATDTSSTSITDILGGAAASAQSALSSIDFTDPTTLAIAGVAGMAFLWLLME
jgi:hypothetical protein